MKKRFFKRVASIAIALTLVLGLFVVPEINAYAEEELPTGLKELEVEIKDVSEEEFNEIVDESQKADVETFVEKCYKGTDSFWYQFSSPYYNYSFSRLNANQRKLYDDLYSKLMAYVDGGADFTYDSAKGVYLTPIVKYTGLTEEEAINVAYLLIYDTPELYYLSQYVGVYIDSFGQMAVRLGVYDEMYTGAQRTYYASQIKSKINWYLSQVSTSASAYDKEKKIHDLLCDNCYYGSFNTPYDQSCASVFLNPGGETVCAGYSEAFALLCCARGIPAMSITSAGHEWNQVKLGNYWYAVDVTWDDSYGSRYKHFNKSDSTMLSLGRAAHTIEGLWSSVGRESCPYDYGNEPGAETVDVASDYTGMAYSNLGNWRYVENGFINYSYTGMANNVWGWWYFTNGNLNWTYTGEASNIFGTWYYENGRINWDYYGIAYTGSHWRMVNGGLIDTGYTGMASNIFGWWYFVNGDIDFNYTGMAWNIFGWWYYNNGQLDWTYTGEASNVYGTWYYENGRINWDYYGIAYTGSHWRMVNGGLIDTGYTGMASNIFGWWYFVNGNIDFNYTGMAYNVFGWWYYTNGQLNWTYTGIGENVFGKWLYINGRIPFDYNGNYNINGVNYMIQGGYVV